MRSLIAAVMRSSAVALVAVLLLASCGPAPLSRPSHSAGATALAGPSETAGADAFTLRTQDGMLLRFDGQGGRFAQLSVRGYSADLAQRPDLGVYLYDPRGAPLLDPYAAPVASYQATDSGLVLTRQSPANAIKVEERWTAHPSYIGLEGRVTSTEQVPSSRGVEACVQLPLDLVGMQWHGQLDRSERIERRPAPYKTVLTRLVDIGSFGDASLHLKSDLDFNLNGVNLIGDATFGLAMAIDSEHPAAYYVSYDASRETYSACFHLGIDKDHVRDNRSATFSLALFSPDNPDQGLRSALKKYISIYPDSFLGALPRATGMVVGDTYNYKEYPDPERYHIQSVWGSVKAKSKERGIYSLAYLWPTGFYDRDMRMKAAPVAGGGDQSWEADIAACLKIYADYEQQQNPFAESCVGSYPFATCQPSRASGQTYGPVYHSESSGWYTLEAFQVTVSNEPNFLFGKFVMRDPIARSLLQDETGGHVKAMSYASAMSEAFWDPGYKRCYFDGIDPDPGLEVTPSREPAPGPAPTQTDTFGELNLEIAKRANGLYGSDYLDTHPEEGLSLFSGAAIDNVGVYLRQDFNPQMLRVASLPLGYDPATASVVAFEHLSMLAFLRALRASLPPEAPIATNGVPISGLLGEGVDFFINEMIPIARDGATVDKIYDETLANKLRLIDRIRMVVNQRPVTLMAVLNRAADEQDLLAQIQTYLPLYTAKGIYINIDRYGQSPEKYFWVAQPKDPAVLAAYRRHLDTVYALNVAGWEPETFARPVDSGGQADPAVLAERFGSGLYTLYNADSQAKRVDLVIDWKRAGFSAAPLGATDHETGAALPLTASGDTLTIAGLQLAPNTVQVIELR